MLVGADKCQKQWHSLAHGLHGDAERTTHGKIHSITQAINSNVGIDAR